MDVPGIDLAKRSFDATLLMSSGTQHYASFANTAEGFAELAAWLAPLCAAPLHACMEATNVYWIDLANFLYTAGHTVSVVNPARIKGFALATLQRNKTDKLDSALIAAFCLKHQPKPWQPPSQQERHLRALVRHRDDLLQTKLQQQNRLRDATDEAVKRSLQKLIELLESELEAVEQDIESQLQAQSTTKSNLALLDSVKGIGLLTAAKLLSEMPNLAEYESAKAAGADVGLSPSEYQSGTSVRRRSKMSKIGKATVRAALYWPAITAMRHCPAMRAFAERLAARGKPKMVIIGAVMRKLIHICYGVLKHQTPYDPAKAFPRSAPST
jgi:transposase